MTHIKTIPLEERPREKAIRYGMNALSAREVLAIILRSGTREKSALDLADDILIKAGGVHNLNSLSKEDLCSIRGISTAKALELLACFELSKRRNYSQAVQEDIVTSPESFVSYLQDEIGNEDQEKFMVVFLNNAHKILATKYYLLERLIMHMCILEIYVKKRY